MKLFHRSKNMADYVEELKSLVVGEIDSLTKEDYIGNILDDIVPHE